MSNATVCDSTQTAIAKFGAEGLGAREIAVELGMTLAALDALTAADAELAAALAQAEEAARAWWEALPRAALAEGKRFNHAGWRAVMRERFGEGEATGASAASQTNGPPWAKGPVYILPCNGRHRRLPDGSCPFANQDTSAWPERWFANHTPHPCHSPPGGDDDAAWEDDDEDFAPERALDEEER